MVIGALVALWIAMLPTQLVIAVLIRLVGIHNPITPMITTAAVLVITLVSMAYGATWFKHLFYKGMLWGYRADKES
jgi:hypothetical protein